LAAILGRFPRVIESEIPHSNRLCKRLIMALICQWRRSKYIDADQDPRSASGRCAHRLTADECYWRNETLAALYREFFFSKPASPPDFNGRRRALGACIRSIPLTPE